MRLIGKLLFIGSFLYVGLFVTSCGDDESIFTPIDTTLTFDVEIVNDGLTNETVAITASNFAGMSTIYALLDFESTDNMRRIYITRDSAGIEEPFDLKDELGLSGQDVKADGSLDLPNSLSNDIEIAFELPIPASGTGTLTYRFWATSGRGSFRDKEKRTVVGVNTVNIVYNSDNPDPDLLTFSNIELFPPTEDLNSESFMSTVDGSVFQLINLENSSLWDIGYNAQGDVPSLSSTSGSPQQFPGGVGLLELINNNRDTGIEELTSTDLNSTYFAALATFDFDGATSNSDLDGLDVDSSDAQEYDLTENATADYYIAFLDVQGRKGVIRVTDLVDGDGDGNFFESNDKVVFDVKVQR